MGDWASHDTTRYSAIGTIEYANSRGTTIRTGSPAHNKGGYALLTPSTPFDADLIGIHIGAGDTICKTLVDIALAPQGGTETVIFHNLMADIATASYRSYSYLFPTPIPARSKISARIQSNSSVSSFNVAGFIAGSGFADNPHLGTVKTYGIITATSSGTEVDPGATANVKGSWTPIATSTTSPIKQLWIVFSGQANDLRTSCAWLVDIAIGASGNEQIIIPNIPVDVADTGDIINPRVTGPFNYSIPTGSRISVRSQCTITEATDRLFEVAIYGVS